MFRERPDPELMKMLTGAANAFSAASLEPIAIALWESRVRSSPPLARGEAYFDWVGLSPEARKDWRCVARAMVQECAEQFDT